jgi:uncharacterized membrane protein YeaQ/YmgE (transglycosylase-associated protein family)
VVISGESTVVILLVGVLVGWWANSIGRGIGFDLIGDVFVGIVGALAGTWLARRYGVQIPVKLIGPAITAAAGAGVLLVALRYAEGFWKGQPGR